MGGFHAIIYAENANNIAITGQGKIDGQGHFQKPRPNPAADDIDGRPRNILFISCNNVTIDGVELWNSGLWNLHLLNCEQVTVNNIKVNNHANKNNDGIDIDGCRKVVMSNSTIDCDDDGIVLKSTGAAPCEDIVITNCIISSYVNAIKAGTESSGGFKNISISNCVIMPSKSKVDPIFNTPRMGVTGISLMIVDGGTMEGININNINIHGTKSPIYIRLANRARKYTKGIKEPPIGIVKNISLSNIIAYGTGSWGISVTGIAGYPVKNVSFNNIQFFSEGNVEEGDYNKTVKYDEKAYPMPTEWKNLPAYGLFIRYVENLSVNQLMLGISAPDVRVPIMAHHVNGLQITNTILSTPIYNKPFVVGYDLINYKIEKPIGWAGLHSSDLIKIITQK
jgi:polygalacturonase